MNQQCKSLTVSGKRCSRTALKRGAKYCWQHLAMLVDTYQEQAAVPDDDPYSGSIKTLKPELTTVTGDFSDIQNRVRDELSDPYEFTEEMFDALK